MKLLSTLNYVEAPYVTMTFPNGVILGTIPNKKNISALNYAGFPNYIQGIDITKINGAINTYKIKIDYPIVPGSDPAFIDKLFASITTSRKVKLSYGDCASPGFVYKEEEVLVTLVANSTSFSTPKKSYTVTALSSAVYAKAQPRNWPKFTGKPSVRIRELLKDKSTGLSEIFTGMNREVINDLIPSGDKEVEVEAVLQMTPFDYINYLIDYMRSDNKSSLYAISVFDTSEAPYYGPYFKISEISSSLAVDRINGMFEVDIGYPSDNNVIDFSTTSNDQWLMLYEYTDKLVSSNISYMIDHTGKQVRYESPLIQRDPTLYKTTERGKNWWRKVTEYTNTATLTIKGLLKPTTLCSYVKVNVYFFGLRDIASGIYFITAQLDSISTSGYKSTLSLTKIKGDTI